MGQHPLQQYPLPFSDPVVQKVLRTLADTYRRYPSVEEVVDDVGLDAGAITFDGPARTMWRSVLKEAARAQQLDELLDYVAAGVPAVKPVIEEARAAQPVGEPPEEEDTAGQLDWKGFSDDSQTERQIVEGHPTLLDVSFLQAGIDRAASVCRLLVTHGHRRFTGTGFRVTDDAILTNHHVLYYDGEGAPTPASAVEAWFGWEVDLRGVPLSPTVVACDAATIVGQPQRDWAVVRTAVPIPDQFPVLPIGDVAAKVAVDDRVYIIQHPGGRPKMIGMHHNLVRFVDDDVLQYWTDTEGGSSGSPVFDKSWSVVALHHRWGERQQDGRTEYYNQGQRIRPIADEMAAARVVS